MVFCWLQVRLVRLGGASGLVRMSRPSMVALPRELGVMRLLSIEIEARLAGAVGAKQLVAGRAPSRARGHAVAVLAVAVARTHAVISAGGPRATASGSARWSLAASHWHTART